MADGADRVLGYLSGVAEKVAKSVGIEESTVGVGGSTGERAVEGHLCTCGDGADVCSCAISIDYKVDTIGRIQAQIDFDLQKMGSFENVLLCTRAVWEGAASKGFPKRGWKY